MAGRFQLPVAHQPFMVLRHGGFSCADCRYLRRSNETDYYACANRDYQEFTQTSELVDPRTWRPVVDPRKACSDWFRPRRRQT